MSKKPTLVVLQLTGGNDGLNTVVPYGDGRYYDYRPKVRIDAKDVLAIDGQYGFHPAMAPLKPFWDDGKMAIIRGIGHPHTNYSHFLSMDMWHSANPEKPTGDGWLATAVREMDPTAENVLTAVNVGSGVPRALVASGVPAASVAGSNSYGLLTGLAGVDRRNTVREVFSSMYDDGINDDKRKMALRHARPEDPRSRVLPYLGRTGLDAKKGAEILSTVIGGYQSTIKYPQTLIGNNLKAIAQIKLAGLGTRVFYTQHSGFDTHANGAFPHADLWTGLSAAVSSFFADLRAHDGADDVVLFMFSEFGRRVADNGGGTDHGAAGLAFVMGDPVKGGMYGEQSSLRESDLEIGNLRHTNDFRSTYASLLEGWMHIDSRPIVNGTFERFSFV